MGGEHTDCPPPSVSAVISLLLSPPLALINTPPEDEDFPANVESAEGLGLLQTPIITNHSESVPTTWTHTHTDTHTAITHPY